MGNIYYPSDAPMGAQKAPKCLFGAFSRAPSPIVSDFLTPDLLRLLLRASEVGIGLSDPAVPLPNISWRREAMHYEVAPGLTLFLPRSIHLTDGQRDYFAVLVGEAVELRQWANMRLPHKTPAQWTDHHPVSGAREVAMIEASLKAAMAHLGTGKSLAERFGHLKGRKLSAEALASLAAALGVPAPVARALAEKVRAAAADPVGYYGADEASLRGRGVDAPSETLHREVFAEGLAQAGRLMALDWKAEPADLRHALGQLCPKAALPGMDEAEDTAQALARCSGMLAPQGWTLLRLAMHGDSEYVMAGEAARREEILALAESANIPVKLFTD